MLRVGASNGIPERMRHCVMCQSQNIESEEHFVADCPFYAQLRHDCLAKLSTMVAEAGRVPSWLTRPSREDLVQLFIGAKANSLPPAVREKAERCVADFLRLAWARRDSIWKQVCRAGKPWKL